MKRTGSSYLVSLLGSHPEIHCCGEIFIPNGVNIRWPKEDGGRRAVRPLELELTALRDTDPAAFLERVFGIDFGRPVVGFKIFRDHHPEMLGRIVDDARIAKIVHYRANVLARYASHLAARKAGDFGRYAEKPLVAFDEAEFVAYHDEHAAFHDALLRKLAQGGQPYHLSRYDEINNPAAILGILKFLGVTPALPEIPEPPTNRGASDLLERFSNPKQVRAFLRGRGLMHWAREGETLFEPLPGPALPA